MKNKMAGDDGARGPEGDVGPQGPKGTTAGDRGKRGSKGIMGRPGPKGFGGIKGNNGFKGLFVYILLNVARFFMSKRTWANNVANFNTGEFLLIQITIVVKYF